MGIDKQPKQMFQGSCGLCKYKITASPTLVLWIQDVLKKHLERMHPQAVAEVLNENESVALGDERMGMAG